MSDRKTSTKSFFDDVLQSKRPMIADVVSNGILIILVFFGGLIVWSVLAPLATGAVITGNIIVEGDRDLIRHPEGGLLDKVFINNGDWVKAGNPLISLVSLQADAKGRQLAAQLLVTTLKYNRLLAEIENENTINTEIIPTSGMSRQLVDSLISAEQRLFQARKNAFAKDELSLRSTLDVAIASKPNLELQKSKISNQLALINQELEMNNKLADKGYASKTQILVLQRQAEGLGRELDQLEAQIEENTRLVASAEAALAKFQAEHVRTLLDDLRQTAVELETLQANYEVSLDERARTIVRAPKSGIVMNLKHDTKGSVLQPSETILELIPADAGLLIEGRLDPTFSANVKKGVPARISILSLKSRSTPTLQGEVTYISPDVLTDEKSGQTYYSVHIKLQDKSLSELDQTLQPGYPAQAIVETSKQSVLYYLISPLISSLDRAFIEN